MKIGSADMWAIGVGDNQYVDHDSSSISRVI